MSIKWVKIGAGWQNEKYISYQLEIGKAVEAAAGKDKIYFSIFKAKNKKSDKSPDFDICTKTEVMDEERAEQERQSFQPNDKIEPEKDGDGLPF